MSFASGVMAVWLVILLGLLVGGIFLQIYLSRQESRWPGLVLPVLTFLCSLINVLSIMDTGSVAQNVLLVLSTVLLGNLPTMVLLAIYWIGRERLKKQAELDKMNIQDL